MKTRRAARVVLGIVLAEFAFEPVAAQQMYVYPTQNQSPGQQNRDRYECHTWSVQQTGVDPTNP